MAWLNATPKPDPRSKRGKIEAKMETGRPKISRRDQLKKKGVTTPKMPPNPLPHIVDRLVEIGLSEAAGMGVGPLSWREIDAWCAGVNIDLDPWERRLIRHLSAEYIAEGRRAELETCPPPWHAPVDQREVETEGSVLSAVLG